MSCNANELVGYALKWVDAVAGDEKHKFIIDNYNKINPLPRNYKVKYTDAWCATFVSFCFSQLNSLDIFPAECSCNKMISKAISLGIWHEDEDYMPNIGDVIFYDWHDNGIGDNKGSADHVGIVYKTTLDSKNYMFEVVEGNMNNRVGKRTLHKNARYIRGFIIPRYTDSVVDYSVIAKEILNGKWGHGSERRKRLEEAGFDWRKAQNLVNEMCGSSVRY